MSNAHLQTPEKEFLRFFVQNSPRLMWFLGAGTSRSSGLPTAVDLIWELKRQYYCSQENQDLQAHKLNNHAIKARIQNYFDAKGCPELWSNEEYSYYFELMFGADYTAQQTYIQDRLSPDKVTLTIGPRVLASLLEMGRSRIVFTTNFDDVLEDAYAAVAAKNLTSFNLEGSYAALEALNTERFPLYAKIHGDFRYQKLKNLSKDLLSNDEQIKKCFVAAAGRYGLIIAGYSGRDSNVMAMLDEALAQPNPFPHGIWWTVPNIGGISSTVVAFLEKAQGMGISAHIVETGTFDVMLQKIWRQIPDKTRALDDKVRSGKATPVSIPIPEPGKSFPLIRTNALEIIDAPRQCGVFSTEGTPASDIFSALREAREKVATPYREGVVFWGDSKEISNGLGGLINPNVSTLEFVGPVAEIAESSNLKSLFEHGIAEALCDDKPLLLRKKGRSFYAVVDYRKDKDERFIALRKAVGYRGDLGQICGSITGIPETVWSECVRLRLEARAGVLWLLLEPDIWVKPLSNREKAQDFLRKRRKNRYNKQFYEILNAWIEILIGSIGQGAPVTIGYGTGTDFPASFTVSTRTAFSRRGTI
ncbi:SIR2 family protein [Marinobacter sp. MA]|uniref:SIR2 family NAD-dependent protein deacylase n=1 Tax=Marinobacter sp. MA TaxID=2971606 RepID=UPI003AAF8DB9